MNHEPWTDELKYDHFPHDGQKKHKSIANDVKDYEHVCSYCGAVLPESEQSGCLCHSCNELLSEGM